MADKRNYVVAVPRVFGTGYEFTFFTVLAFAKAFAAETDGEIYHRENEE